MTTLDAVLAAVETGRKRFVVYADDDVETAFVSRNVDVERRELPPPVAEPFVVVEDDGEFVGAIALAALDALLEPPVVEPEEPDDVSRGYRVVFELLDESVYRGVTQGELLADSREVEERAYRIGTGTLRVSFQSLSRFEARVEQYRRLGERPELDVHVSPTTTGRRPPSRG